MPTVSGLGARVYQLRGLRGWTQEELANASGVAQTTVSAIESGRVTRTGVDNIERLARAFGVTRRSLYEAAGLIEAEEEEAQAAVAGASLSMPLDVETVIRFVESRPGADYQARLARLRALLPEDQYRQLLVRVFAAWEANSELALDAFGLGH